MSTQSLPNTIDPRRYAEKRRLLSGELPVKEFSRLASSLIEPEGRVHFNLDFDLDEEKRRIVSGTASSCLKVECQRCLSPMPIELKAEINLAIVKDEATAKLLPKRYDPLVLAVGDEVSIVDLLEDELLLELPLFAMHESDQCDSASPYLEKAEVKSGQQESSVKKESPFSVLSQLKKK